MKGLKTGGRVKGSTNKDTAQIREKVTLLITNQLETLEDDLKKLTPKERLDIIVKLLPYSIQRLYNTELQIEYVNNSKGTSNDKN
jgi:23S rRNA C2498 (ribose-2'-O)-methylase RlmM